MSRFCLSALSDVWDQLGEKTKDATPFIRRLRSEGSDDDDDDGSRIEGLS